MLPGPWRSATCGIRALSYLLEEVRNRCHRTKRTRRPDETITYKRLIQYPNPRVPRKPASIEPTSINPTGIDPRKPVGIDPRELAGIEPRMLEARGARQVVWQSLSV